MRIWLINQHAVPTNIPGITRHYELAQEWGKVQDVEVILWLTTFLHSLHRFIKKEEKESIPNTPTLKFKWLWSFPYVGNDVRRIINMISFAANLLIQGIFAPRPDVIVASTPPLFVPWVGWFLSRIKGCPFVLEVRDLWPDSLVKVGGMNNRFILTLLTRLESFLYRKADRIIVLTEHQSKFIQNKGIKSTKIDLIPNGVVTGSWQPKPEKRQEFRRRLGIPANKYLAIYTGAHGPSNGLQYVVLSGKYLTPDISIILIGDGPEKKNLIKLRDDNNITNVYFKDPVPKDKILDYTFAADCGIISLLNNDVFRGARPNKLFDYTFVGIPIITTVDGEVRFIVEDHDLGIFAGVENPKSLALALKEAKEFSLAKLSKIRENGRDYINLYGNRGKLAKKYLKILKSVICR